MRGKARRRRCIDTKAPRRSAAPFCWRLVVMARAPQAGAAKTRLAREIGSAHAVRFVRHAAAALLERVGYDRRWHTTLAVAPDTAAASRAWPRGIAVRGQGGGDLGRRMQRLFDTMPKGPLVIAGTDIPAIEPKHIAAAFRALGRHDVVLGPAADGGYWLIGMRRRPHVLRPFARVRWSSVHALSDTLANLAGRSIGYAATLTDVDCAESYRLQARRIGRRVPPRD